MLEELRRLLRNSGIYVVGIVISKALGFIMIPIYTRYLAPRDYGTLEILDLILYSTAIIAAMGINGAIFRFYSMYESERDKKEVVATAALYMTALAVVVSGLIILFAVPIARATLGADSFAPLVRIMACVLLFSNMTEVPLSYWRAKEQQGTFFIASVSRTVVGAAALAIALAGFKAGVKGALYANLFTNALAGIGFSAVAMWDLPKRVVWVKLGQMLRYGLPLVPTSLASFILVYSDRFFLRHFGTLGEVGVYALGYKLAMVLPLVINVPFQLVWQWQQFELAKREDAQHIYARMGKYILLVSVFFGLGLSLLSKEVIEVLTPQSYWSAYRIVPLIALCYVFDAIRNVVISGMYLQKDTRHLAAVTVPVALLDLALNYLLISRFLAMGAAVATLVAYATNLFACLIVAQRLYKIPYEYARSAIALFSAVAMYLAADALKLPLVLSLLLKVALLGSFLWICTRLLHPDELAMARDIGGSVARKLGWRQQAAAASGS